MANGSSTFAKVQRVYYLDGYVVEFRTWSVDPDGNGIAVFDIIDEANRLVGNVRLVRERIRQREDVVFEARKQLGLVSSATDGLHAHEDEDHG